MRFASIAIVLGFFCLLFPLNIVSAQDVYLGQSKINAASPLYFLKSVKEILQLRLAKTPEGRALYELAFAASRIREVNSLAGTSQEYLIEPTLEKYWSQVQAIKGQANLGDHDIAKRVSGAVVEHMANLQMVSSKLSDSRAKRSIRLTTTRLVDWEAQLVSKLTELSQPLMAQKVMNSMLSGCNFLSKEASSSALNAVEKAVLTERANSCQLPVK